MNSNKSLKLAPSAILVIFLGYLAYSVQPSTPAPPTPQPGLVEVQDALEGALVDSVKAGGKLIQTVRDPFLAVTSTKAAAPPPPKDVEPEPPEADPLIEVVQGLTLQATFLQGPDQIAVINGRIYRKGEHLSLNGDSGDRFSPLYVASVQPTKVILRAGGGSSYNLSYPNQFGRRPEDGRKDDPSQDPTMAAIDDGGQAAMFRNLLNSPLGALGKSLVGDALPGAKDSKSKSRSRGGRSRARSTFQP
jgi:hypothetical protein